MCGIAGIVTSNAPMAEDQLAAEVREMAKALTHRGPDDGHEWVDADSQIALGHRRLSIIDLSPLGRQPMSSPSGRFVIVYNGEVYNFVEMRRALTEEGYAFRGGSDTEVILAAIEHYGLHGAVQRFIGMFAFALWDRQDRKLFLARDRLGIKPLYYGFCRGNFVFASELKSLTRLPWFDAAVDRRAVDLFLRYSCVPAPHCIYEGIRKLQPGEILSFDCSGQRTEAQWQLERYWCPQAVAEEGISNPLDSTDENAAETLRKLLLDAVGQRMVADVPLGAFLSGGYDSTLVVALMQAQAASPVKTFSIGFDDAHLNEADHASAVARHLGTDHHELYVSDVDALAVVPDLGRIFDEPFADSSQIPTYLVARMAREEVTVSLSGDGGDELFAGYNRHVWAESLRRRVAWLPSALRTGVGRTLSSVAPETWDTLLLPLQRVLPTRLRMTRPGVKVNKLGRLLDTSDPVGTYDALVSFWQGDDSPVLGLGGQAMRPGYGKGAAIPNETDRMMYMDLTTYLPDDILTKVDRTSMAVGLEARVPLLDHRVVEWAWRLPRRYKLRDGTGKWILRELVHSYVPKALMDRPKTGFGIPVGTWLCGALRDWTQTLLDPSRIASEGYLDPRPIDRAWRELRAGNSARAYDLWNVLMFQAWLEDQQ